MKSVRPLAGAGRRDSSLSPLLLGGLPRCWRRPRDGAQFVPPLEGGSSEPLQPARRTPLAATSSLMGGSPASKLRPRSASCASLRPAKVKTNSPFWLPSSACRVNGMCGARSAWLALALALALPLALALTASATNCSLCAAELAYWLPACLPACERVPRFPLASNTLALRLGL